MNLERSALARISSTTLSVALLAVFSLGNTDCGRSGSGGVHVDAGDARDAAIDAIYFPCDAGEAAYCGGLAGIACPSTQFCDFPVATACGATDQSGSCRTAPTLCTDEVIPVCGCDGITYSNACGAAANSVSVLHTGACNCVAPPCAAPPTGCSYVGGGPCECGTVVCPNDDAGVPTSCGGFTGVSCQPGQFCDYAVGDFCGAADQLGTCRTTPEVCPLVWNPVCGCDGTTYANDCHAAMASASVLHVGACACVPPPCAAPPPGCNYEGGTMCTCGTLVCPGGVGP